MKHLKYFEHIFTSGIENTKIDPEIVDNCRDIVRDFNEDNNCDLSLYIRYYDSINLNSFNNTNLDEYISLKLNGKKDVVVIGINGGGNGFSYYISICEKHLLSYFESIGHQHIKYKSYFFFYED